MNFIVLIYEIGGEPARWIPHCIYCEVVVVSTIFSNKITRRLCPTCKRKMYLQRTENGVAEARGYSINWGNKK